MNDKKKYPIQALEDIQMRLACGIDNVSAIHELMASGSSTAESYLDELYGVYDYLRMLNKELAETIENVRAEKKAVTV